MSAGPAESDVPPPPLVQCSQLHAAQDRSGVLDREGTPKLLAAFPCPPRPVPANMPVPSLSPQLPTCEIQPFCLWLSPPLLVLMTLLRTCSLHSANPHSHFSPLSHSAEPHLPTSGGHLEARVLLDHSTLTIPDPDHFHLLQPLDSGSFL